MARRDPTAIRLSATLDALLQAAGQNKSATIRALVLLGADAAGLNVADAQDDLRHALKDSLSEPVTTALLELLQRVRKQAATQAAGETARDSAPEQVSQEAPAEGGHTQQATEGDDPFAAVGFTFD